MCHPKLAVKCAGRNLLGWLDDLLPLLVVLIVGRELFELCATDERHNTVGLVFHKLAQVERNEAAKRTASRRMIGGISKALPVIWFAIDTFNALVEYRDTVQ